MSLKLNMLTFCPFISLKIEKGATRDASESEDSLLSYSSEEAHIEVMIRAGEVAIGKQRRPIGMVENHLTEHLFDTSSSSSGCNGSSFRIGDAVCNLKSGIASNEVSKAASSDIIDGIRITSSAPKTQRVANQGIISNLVFVHDHKNGNDETDNDSVNKVSLVSRRSYPDSHKVAKAPPPITLNSMLRQVTIKRKGTTLTPCSLNSPGGKLRCKLVHSSNHLPLRNLKKHTSCQMHFYMEKKVIRSQLSYCPTCNVVLCIDCYSPFHFISPLLPDKVKFRGRVQKITKV